MSRDEIKEMLSEMWEQAQELHLGSGEAELEFIENVTNLLEGKI
jgi:hypothetical protein